MNRENRTRHAGTTVRRTVTAVIASAIVSIASPAVAAEGGLVLTPDLPMLLALLVLFIALIFPVNALLFRPIFAALDAREDKIAGTRTRADKLAAEAEEVLQRYQHSVREARESAEQERRSQLATAKGQASDTMGDARSEAEHEIAQARTEIQTALEAARVSLRDEAATLAREASTRILGRDVS